MCNVRKSRKVMYKIPIQTKSYFKNKCSNLIPNYVYIFLYSITLSTEKKKI